MLVASTPWKNSDCYCAQVLGASWETNRPLLVGLDFWLPSPPGAWKRVNTKKVKTKTRINADSFDLAEVQKLLNFDVLKETNGWSIKKHTSTPPTGDGDSLRSLRGFLNDIPLDGDIFMLKRNFMGIVEDQTSTK